MLKFVMLPAEVLEHLKGKSKALHVLSVLGVIRNVRTNETRFVSKPTLAQLAGISTRHTYRVISELESMGLIECITERRGEYMWRLPCLANADQKPANVKQFMTDEEIKADIERMLKEGSNDG